MIILGDNTLYDTYVYIPNDKEAMYTKIIKKDDYIVVR